VKTGTAGLVSRPNELLTMATGGTNTVFTYDDWGRTASKAMSGYVATYEYGCGVHAEKVEDGFAG
jgi:YD repeat-containing protein